MNQSHIIELLPEILKKADKEAQRIIDNPRNIEFQERINNTNYLKSENILYQGDNIEILEDLLKKNYKEKIDLIYIDPPFFTMADYKSRIPVLNGDKIDVIEYLAYRDIWEEGIKEYLEVLSIRLFLMRELLSNRGSIYVHLDFRAVHYIKIILDYIFGMDNFINEIIWSYKSGGTSKRYFARKHDTILFYGKSKDYIFNPQKEKSYNRNYKPYRFKGVKEYEDDLGWYTLVNQRDVWQIDMVGRTSKERVGYGTQKPEKLLERIILASSNENSIVADFFAGSGTTGIVASKHNRQWIMADLGGTATVTMEKRLIENNFKDYIFKSKYEDRKINGIEIDFYSMERIDDNKYKINLNLSKYFLNLDYIQLNKKNKELIERMLNKDSLAVLDYISVVLRRDDGREYILFQDYRKEDYLKIDGKINFDFTNTNEGVLYMRIVDIFGNPLYQKIN